MHHELIVGRRKLKRRANARSQVPLSPLIEYELAFMATCENCWMGLYKLSTYRLGLPFVYFSVLRWNVVCGKRQNSAKAKSQEVLTSAAGPRAPSSSSAPPQPNFFHSTLPCLPTFLMPRTPRCPCPMTNLRCISLMSFTSP